MGKVGSSPSVDDGAGAGAADDDDDVVDLVCLFDDEVDVDDDVDDNDDDDADDDADDGVDDRVCLLVDDGGGSSIMGVVSIRMSGSG